jgi:hypothetical protein
VSGHRPSRQSTTKAWHSQVSLKSHRIYEKTGTVGLEYDIVTT